MTSTLWNSLSTPSTQTSTLLEGLLAPLCIYDLQGQTRYASPKFLQLLQVAPEEIDFFCYFPSLSTNLMVLQDYWQQALQGNEMTFTCNPHSSDLKLSCSLKFLPQENYMVLMVELIEDNQPCILADQYEKSMLSLLNCSSSAIALTNSLGKVLKCNQRFYELLQIKNHRPLNIGTFVYVDDRDLDHHLQEQLLKHEISSYTVEKRLITDSQNMIWVNFRASKIDLATTHQTNETFFAILMEDVTEQHKLYEALIRTEEKWKTLVLNSSHLFLQVSDIGRILYVSPGVERILEYKEEELLDRSILDLIHPHDLQDFGLAFKQWQSNYQVHQANLECRWQSKTKGWMYLYIQGQRFPMTLGLEGIAISGYNISDRKHLELELKASEKKLESLTEKYPLQIVNHSRPSRNCQYN